jgi:HAE1 family hydrophobic/amphiphilic exporter-1
MDNNKQDTNTDLAYLERLEFKPELRKTWLNFFVTNFRVVVLLIVMLSAWGIYSFMNLPRESDPEVKIPYAMIITTFPGASPSDMEELVTKKIETKISGVKGVKKITSSSSNSLSSITVEFDSNEDQSEALRNLRDKVSAINDLPADVNEPSVNEISLDDTPIFTFSLSGPYDGLVLRTYAEKIQDELEKIQGVREVNISGGDEKEFEVAYDPQKLALYGITANQANLAIGATNVAIAGGNFEGTSFNYPVRTDARFFDERSLGNVPINHDGVSIVQLKDIAAVREKAIERNVYSRLSVEGSKPQEAVTISVVKKTGGSIIATTDACKKTIGSMVKTFPEGISYDTTTDTSKLIQRDFNQLTHDFLLTLALVMTILFLIVGFKEAVVAGLAIPLVFFATFGIMLMTGITLNFLSLFSLLLSLGLLVDDAIVVVSATKQYMKTGKFTPEEAVLLVLNDFKVVLTSTTLATTWAFLPLLFSTGIMGEYIKSIPITVSVTLIASLAIALFINHPLAAVLERIRFTRNVFRANIVLLLLVAISGFISKTTTGSALTAISLTVMIWLIWWYRTRGKSQLLANESLVREEWKSDELIKKKLSKQGTSSDSSFSSRLIHGIIHFDKIIPVYEKYLKMVLSTKKRRWITLFATFALFIAAIILPITGVVPSEFFPVSDQDNIYINIEAPTGLNLDKTDEITRQVEEKLSAFPQIANFSTVVGKSGSFGKISGGSSGSTHLASITITLVDKEKRSQKSYELEKILRKEIESTEGAKITVEAPSGGPPSGAAFEAQVHGDDLQELDRVVKDLGTKLATIKGVVNIDSSLKEAPAQYTFALDPTKMELYGLNASYVGSSIRMAISGVEVSTIIKDNKELDVVARFDKNKLPDLESVQNIQLTNLQGNPVYIKDVATIKLESSIETISRIDQKRTAILSAGTEGKTRPNDVLAQFQKKIAEEYELPEGYSITYGGENEENQESVMSIIRAMAIAAVLIISTLIIQFNSFKKSMIVLVTLPLALIGVFFGLAIFGVSLSFPGLIGVLALFGIVVKNAIILIDKINLNIKSGIPFNDSIVDAGKSRLEAIFITSICTIAGIIPVTISNEMWTALGSAVIFGLTISSFFTLFIIPILFKTFVKQEEC